jgi:ABC-type transport system involved in multi-copper enzyme maturation permease subunit
MLSVGIVISMLSLPLGFLGGPTAVMAGVACWATGIGAQDAILRSGVAQVVSMNKRGGAFGAFNGVYGVMWFAGSAIMGILYDHSVFAVVAFGVLGVLMMSGEYSTGMIRSSLTAVPRRLPVLWSKLAVFACAIFSVSLVASFISFFLGQALLSSHHLGVSITAPGALRSVIGAALYVTVAGMIGVALATLFRNTAAGIATFAGVFFVIPPLVGLLPSSVSSHLTPYLPSNAGGVLWGGAPGVTNALSPWTGFALLCGYGAVLIAAAAWRLRRADA